MWIEILDRYAKDFPKFRCRQKIGSEFVSGAIIVFDRSFHTGQEHPMQVMVAWTLDGKYFSSDPQAHAWIDVPDEYFSKAVSQDDRLEFLRNTLDSEYRFLHGKPPE